jgi:pantoate--beta-alanine ligase
LKLIATLDEIRSIVKDWRKKGLTVGLVPTMGYFHDGHLKLMKEAKKENDRVIVSLFVNPTQFGPSEDFNCYPKDMNRDKLVAESVGVDVIFAPTKEEMYPESYQTWVEVEQLSQGLCGASRPGHFRGVTTVVTKLFMILMPDRAYFGQKDAQQLRVIRRMVRDLNIPIEIRPVPIVREPDGLAMSSRNVYLSPAERRAALVLSRALTVAEKMALSGEREVVQLRQKMLEVLQAEPMAKTEYLQFVDDETLEPVEKVQQPVLVALAVRIGKTRLIDNIVIV